MARPEFYTTTSLRLKDRTWRRIAQLRAHLGLSRPELIERLVDAEMERLGLVDPGEGTGAA